MQPLLSDAAASAIADKDLNESENTTLETTLSMEEETSTISAGDEGEQASNPASTTICSNEAGEELSGDDEDALRSSSNQVPASPRSPAAHAITPESASGKTVIDRPSGVHSPRTPAGHGESRSVDDDDDYNSDSSDDESSYFRDPSHLPRPKSEGRRYSYSSSNSPVAASPDIPSLTNQREACDLSLSFSEDSEDGGNHHHHHRPRHQHPRQPMPPIAHPGHDPSAREVFSQPGITRLRSYSSLVSDGEGGGHDDLSSDPCVGELENAASGASRDPSAVPSGRISPIMGEHPPSRGVVLFPSPTPNMRGSPPTISNVYQHQVGYYQPQPHSMTQEQMAVWMAAANAAYEQHQLVVNPYHGGRAGGDGDGIFKRDGWQSVETAHSHASTMEYSEDSHAEANDAPVTQYAMGPDDSDRKLPASEGGRPHGRGGTSDRRKTNGSSKNSSASGLKTSTVEQGHSSSRPSGQDGERGGGFTVYWRRWVMLMYMSVLNLLSDWTCYSVAPIALLTEQAFGSINPELLVTVFLAANAVASACEPIILSRLGLRRTVLFGALLLMMGSIVKSGGMPPIIHADLEKGQGEWRVYLGFLLVGLSQPLYQCTPALLSASWFPDVERTMATGVALNANQLGIGFAFIFGTLLVADSDDIPSYFGLLSLISTATFLGVLFQFEDAPPTPPSDTARVMRGTLDVKIPSVQTMFDSIRNFGASQDADSTRQGDVDSSPFPNMRSSDSLSPTQTNNKGESEARRRHVASQAPAPANWGPVRVCDDETCMVYPAPSPANEGPVAPQPGHDDDEGAGESQLGQQQQAPVNPFMMNPYMYGGYPYGYPPPPFPGAGQFPPGAIPGGEPGTQGPPVYSAPIEAKDGNVNYPYPAYPQYPPQAQVPYWDPRFQQYGYFQQGSPFHPTAGGVGGPYSGYQFPPQAPYPIHYDPRQYSMTADDIDEGAEPILTVTPHHLDIDIRDDQVLLSIKACMARKGFIHALVSFTVSGIVINTLSTFMDYLVRLNGAGREYTGIVGGTFQFVIMISSLIVGKICDTTRAYYSITIFMLVLGAFGLAQCGVSLDAARGDDLRWSLVVVAVLVGPLQPISTELGVEVVYPLSENTVLVIQQLFSNLLSALFIPCFKAMKDIGYADEDATDIAVEKPEYTFSFYLLIVLHAAATVFFATYNGRYLRFEHELEKKAEEEERKRDDAESRAFRPPEMQQDDYQYPNERMPLIAPRS